MTRTTKKLKNGVRCWRDTDGNPDPYLSQAFACEGCGDGIPVLSVFNTSIVALCAGGVADMARA